MGWSGRAMGFLSNKENIVHLLLIGSFAVLGARSVVQQEEIDALEAEKESLRSRNRAMQKSMWEWRQALFKLHQEDPSRSPISLARLRDIYGEKDPQTAEVSVAYSIPPLPYMPSEQQGLALEQGTADPTATIAV